MNNEDLQRLYDVGTDLGRPGDFVRRDKNGKVPGGLTLNKYTVSDATNMTQLQALTQFLGKNIGRIIAIYGLDNYGNHSSLSYTVNTTGSTPYLELTSAPYIVSTNEIQIRQITKSSTVIDRWVSLISQTDDKIVKIVVNGKSGYSSIEVYYL